MRFIVDESTGAGVAQFLRSAGHDVIAVAEVMPQADDSAILDRAALEGRVVVTNDKHFGELVFRSGRAHQGVLLFRLRDESAANRVRVAKAVLTRLGERLQGSFVVATERRVRVRRSKA